LGFDYSLLTATLTCATTVLVTVIGGFFAVETKKRKIDREKTERRAMARAEESRLSMQLMSANTGLVIVTAIAVKEGRVNGKMDAALVKADKAQKEYYELMNRLASEQIAK